MFGGIGHCSSYFGVYPSLTCYELVVVSPLLEACNGREVLGSGGCYQSELGWLDGRLLLDSVRVLLDIILHIADYLASEALTLEVVHDPPKAGIRRVGHFFGDKWILVEGHPW